VRFQFAVLLGVLLALSCSWSGRYQRCGADSDCSTGQTCAHDRIGNYCLVACDVSIDAGHDPRCPPEFTCWTGASDLQGNVCREGVDPAASARMLGRYLSRLDGGLCCGDSYLFVVDGGELLEHRPLFSRDR